jgi:protein-S-isoprenylcysteine O-methyltransferase Ste14
MGHYLFWTFSGIWLLIDFYILVFYTRFSNKENKERKSKYIMIILICLGVLLPTIIFKDFGDNFLKPFNIFRYFSILFLFFGFSIRIYAVVLLGKFFSANVGVRKNQKLVKEGIYKYIRHPSYLGEIMCFTGVAIAFFHPIASFTAFVFPVIAFLIRIKIEEKILEKSFCNEYHKYRLKTKKLIPFIF